MATIAVFGVVAGGGAYAASKIGTNNIENKAVTAKKLDSGAVTTGKLSAGAVTGGKIANGAVSSQKLSPAFPLPIASAEVYGTTVFGWTNRLTDQEPTVTSTQPGVYDVRIPGLDELGVNYDELLSSATLADGPNAGEISTGWTANSAGEDLHPIVYTFDSSGNPANRGFVYQVSRAEHNSLGDG
jgi:hypothetical protein